MSQFKGFGRFLAVLLVFGFSLAAHADKTLMWLADWYQMGNIDTITTVQSVYIPHYSDTTGSGNGTGYYYGTKDQLLTKSNAYATPIPVNGTNLNATLPESLHVPTEVARSWYSLPSFSTASYQGGRIRIYMNYQGQMHRLVNNNTKMQIDLYPSSGTGFATGQTDQLEPEFVNKCIDSAMGDSVWFWTGATAAGQISSNASAASIKCLDHNPFFAKVGTVHLLNPWPGKTVWVQVGNVWQPLYPENGRQGWVSTTIWQDPRTAAPFKVRFASGNPLTSSSVQYLDAGGIAGNASGVAIDLTAQAGTDAWVIPPTTTTKPTVAVTKPAVKLTLMIHRPAWSASAVRVLWKGLDARYIASSTEYCDWFVLTFYEGAIPEAIALRHPFADTIFGSAGLEKAPANIATYANWIPLNPILAAAGSIWLETDGNKPTQLGAKPATVTLCDEKILAFSAYDFSGINGSVPRTDTYFYEPFSQLGPDNNCPGSGNKATKGLVMSVLVNGLPRMNKAHKSACGINTTDSTAGPQYWFDTLWRSPAGLVSSQASAGGTQLNYFHCVRVPLKLQASTGYYTYSNSTFWPLDTAKSVPTPYRNATGTDFKFAMHAKAAFEYVPGLKFEFIGDDDVWIFIDKKLALDVGGQHGPNGGIINLDNLGLVEGKSYQFDMFYTERMGDGSSISIKTSMNLVPTIDVLFDSTAAKPGQYDYVSWILETTNRADICPELGSSTTTIKRRGQASYVLVAPDLIETTLDSAIAVNYAKGLVISDLNSHIWIDTTQLKKYFVQSGTYQIRITVGTEERIVPFTVSSDAVKVRGTMLDANGDGQPDSVVLRAEDQAAAFKSVAYAVVRWADRSGLPDSAVIPAASLLHQPVGDSVLVGRFTLPLRTECPPTGCTGNMGSVYTLNGGDTLRNPVVALADGIAPVADSAWLVFDTTGTGKDTLYVLASETVIATLAGPLPAGDSAFALTGRTIAHLPVLGTPTVVGNLVKLAIDPAANPIQPGDSIRLGGYSGDALGNQPGVLSKWVPLVSSPVAKSWMLDVDGDGAPDSIGIAVKGSLGTATQALVRWKTASGLDTTVTIATPTGIGTGLRLPAGILGKATWCSGCTMEVTQDGQVRRILLLDSVAPIALSAKLRFGVTKDTLLVTVSEVFTIGSGLGEGAASVKAAGSSDVKGSLVGGAPSATGTTLQIVVDTGTVAADSLRLRGWILGNLNKAVGAVSPFVPIEYGPQPVVVTLFDRNGDGGADSVRFRMARSATGAPVPSSFGVTWAATTIHAASLVRSLDGMSWSGGIGPFPLATSCSAGCLGWIVTASGDSTSYASVVEDSIAPVAVSASLRYGLGGQPDTLDVTASENLAKALAGAWVETGVDRAAVHGNAVPASVPGTISADGIRLIVPAGTVPSNDSILRLGNLLADVGGARVGDASRWVVLASIPRGQATLLDADQDGAADSVWFEVRGRLGSGNASVVWGTGADGIRSVVVPAGMSTSFGVRLATPFPYGVTSCGASTGCTVQLADGATLNLLDGVAPVALRARYRFGTSITDPDTLVMITSEGLQATATGTAWIDWGIPGTSRDPVPFSNNPPTTLRADSLVALVPAGAVPSVVATHAGLAIAPQLRGFTDFAGVAVGTSSPMVPLEFGAAPLGAALSDRDGDGRPEGVSVQMLRKAPVVPAVASFTILWTAPDGSALSRVVDASTLSWSSNSGVWSGSLSDPFPYGATLCAGSCGGSVLDSTGSVRAFRYLTDSVAPVPVSASLRFSLPEVARDTLVVTLSEEWGNPDPDGLNPADPIVVLGRSASPVPLVDALSWSLGTDRRTLVFVLDEAKLAISAGDSLRLSGGALARVRDAQGNAPGEVAPWCPIVFGLRPPWFHVSTFPGFARGGEGEVWPDYPAGTQPIDIYMRPVGGASSSPVATGPWVALDGSAGGADTTASLGILLTLNRPASGYLFIYDNIGTHVANIDLSKLADVWSASGTADESRQVWIRWKGISMDGKISSPGVYLFRLVVWPIPDALNAPKEPINHIFKLGWKP